MYKIYINENPLILCKSGHEIVEKSRLENLLVVKYRNQPKTFFPYIDSLENTVDKKTVILFSDDLKLMWRDFKSLYLSVRASGGVTINNKGQVLAIYRRGYWDLPKGKIEAGEKKKEAGIREVQEETGIASARIVDKLTKTYHTYRVKGVRALKITHWYVMRSNDINLKPQKKEGIEDVKWINIEDWPKLKEPTFKNIFEVIDAYKARLAQSGGN